MFSISSEMYPINVEDYSRSKLFFLWRTGNVLSNEKWAYIEVSCEEMFYALSNQVKAKSIWKYAQEPQNNFESTTRPIG